MAKLIIIRGIPGSGKTTYAKKLQELLKTDPVHLESDMFFMKDGEYCFDFKFLGDAHKWCQSTAALSLFNGIDVIVSNTFIKYKEIKPYYEMALKYNADFEIFNMAGNYGSVHGVPEEVMERMKSNFNPITTKEYIVHYAITNDSNNNFTKQRVPVKVEKNPYKECPKCKSKNIMKSPSKHDNVTIMFYGCKDCNHNWEGEYV